MTPDRLAEIERTVDKMSSMSLYNAVKELLTVLTEARQERDDALALLTSDPNELHSECVCQIERLVIERDTLQRQLAKTQEELTPYLAWDQAEHDALQRQLAEAQETIRRYQGGEKESTIEAYVRLQRQVDTLEKILLGAKYDLQAILDYGGPTTKAERGALRNRVRQAEAALRGGKML